MNHDHRLTDMLIGLGLGLTVGAVTALLLAPQSGRRTRRHLLRAGEDAIETARDGLGSVREVASEKTRRLADTLARV